MGDNFDELFRSIYERMDKAINYGANGDPYADPDPAPDKTFTAQGRKVRIFDELYPSDIVALQLVPVLSFPGGITNHFRLGKAKGSEIQCHPLKGFISVYALECFPYKIGPDKDPVNCDFDWYIGALHPSN